MTIFASLLLSLFLTVTMTPVFGRLAKWLEIYDLPGPRKVHQWPVPRVGGMAMAVGALVPILLWAPQGAMIRAYIMGALVLVAFGIADDWKGLSFKAKFVAQIAAALIAIFYGDVRIVRLGDLLPGGMVLGYWVSVILTLVTMVGVTNAINLADGLDGLAGGICMLSFCCVGYIAWTVQDLGVLIPMAALIGAIVGFLRFNTYPATLFMGDTGSMLLGFSAIFFSLALTQGEGSLSPLLPLVILGFPVLDTLSVMVERMAQGRSPFSADKRHFHHRFMKMGLYHTESVLAIYVIQALLVTSALLFRSAPETAMLTGYLVFAGAVLIFFHWADAAGWKYTRTGFFDRLVKAPLRDLRERGVFIRVIFQAAEWGVPLLVVATCFLPAQVSPYYSVFAAGLLAWLLLAFIVRRDQVKDAFTISLYLFIPVLVYLSDEGARGMGPLLYPYYFSFLLFVILVLITLRLTRRKMGFKPTTMDFLVVFVTLVLMFLPELRMRFGLMAVKTIVLFFCYEIILGETRDKIWKVAALTALAYLVIAVRGLAG